MKRKVMIFSLFLVNLALAGTLSAQEPDAAVEAIKKNTVVTALEGYKPDDVYDMDKVTAAFAAARKEMFYTLDLPDGNGRGDYWPTPDHKKDPLGLMTTQKLGDSQAFWEGIHPYPDFRLRTSPIPTNTPLLIWHIEGTWAVAVSFDGAVFKQEVKIYHHSYNKNFIAFKQTVAPKSKWPKPFYNKAISTGDIQVWENAGAVEAGTIEKLMKLKEQITTCSDKTWAKYDRQFDRIDNANITERTRENRYNNLARKVERQVVNKKCKRLIGKFEKITKGITKTWMKRRKAMYKQASTRLAEFAAQ